ncbi:ADP-ribosylation factor-like protein 10 isoform X1 [Anas platyrhynchos]|uniref:ADP-ribosylation factor-like protein 10 isoform X1 n=1 Tax=Anas platyrhynchos TaxID=8839 RepID=UPI003AF2F7B8
MAPPRALRDLTLALGAAVVALGSLLFIAWKLYFCDTELGASWDSWWEREVKELRDRAPPGSTVEWKQVLVLGLDGAGKSSVLHYICSQTVRKRIPPTLGFNSAQLQVEGLEMDLLEVGGSQNLRAYWSHYLSGAHVLVFVVDSVDRERLLTARQELHALLAQEPRLPLVVLANKQGRGPQPGLLKLQARRLLRGEHRAHASIPAAHRDRAEPPALPSPTEHGTSGACPARRHHELSKQDCAQREQQ